MAEYNPSKIIKDGNTYNFRDTTKIPLAGSNAISGDLIPATDNSIDVGSSTKNLKMLYTKGITIDGTQFLPSDYIPRSGGQVLSGSLFAKPVDNSYLAITGSTYSNTGASIWLYGKNVSSEDKGKFWIGASNETSTSWLVGTPDGSLVWKGQPIQYGSDQRLKQQIAEIDDKLLDAWEDVDLVQFKYNDAVDAKKDKARLHTGYVVQQIDKACKSHGVDVSQYGLYCHEEYPQETEEVEVEQEDGTKVKERKVIREASEHYSLRYTEALIVECAYLRKCIKELRTEIEQLKSSK